VSSPVSRYIVEGRSMEPAYHAGDRVLVYRWAYRRRVPAAGDAVVVRDPERPGHVLLKRVASGPATPGAVFLTGDNAAESRDSRTFGRVPVRDVLGRAWFRY
jgi:signal peptidase I